MQHLWTWTLLLFCLFAQNMQAQNTTKADSTKQKRAFYSREISMNMSPLLTMLIPFNRTDPNLAGPYMIQTIKYKGDNFFRFSFGARINGTSSSDGGLHFNTRIGWGKRRFINERLSYLISGDINLSIGNSNTVFGTRDVGSLTVGPTWGIQYRINDKVNIGTDTALQLGVSADIFSFVVIDFIPPVSIFLNIEIPPKKRRKRKRNKRISDSDWYQ